MNERINELLLLSLSHNDCYLPFGMRRSSRSLSKLLKLAAKAWVILRDVPGVRGGTWDGRSNGQVQVVVKVVVVQSLSWENKQDNKKNRQLSLEKKTDHERNESQRSWATSVSRKKRMWAPNNRADVSDTKKSFKAWSNRSNGSRTGKRSCSWPNNKVLVLGGWLPFSEKVNSLHQRHTYTSF